VPAGQPLLLPADRAVAPLWKTLPELKIRKYHVGKMEPTILKHQRYKNKWGRTSCTTLVTELQYLTLSNINEVYIR
jgi:hypothetical protein